MAPGASCSTAPRRTRPQAFGEHVIDSFAFLMLGSVVGLCGGRLGEPRDVLLLGLLRPHVVRRGVLQVGPRVGDVWAAVDGWMLGRVCGDPLGALCGGPLRHAVRWVRACQYLT